MQLDTKTMKVGSGVGGGAILAIVIQQLFSQGNAIAKQIQDFRVEVVQRLVALEAKHEFYHGNSQEAEAVAATAQLEESKK